MNNSWSISNKYDTICVGDAYVGKTTYLNALVSKEKESNVPVMISKDQNEFEFWIENKSKKAIFSVKDTANQERFRSLTQAFYRKAECVLLIFDLFNYDSFNNLINWYTDIFNYCKNKDDRFAIVLVGIKNKQKFNSNSNSYSTYTPIDQKLIQQFVDEKSLIIGYCEIDMQNNDCNNLKMPFEILFDYFLSFSQSRPSSINYFAIESQNLKKNSIIELDGTKLKPNKEKKECCKII